MLLKSELKLEGVNKEDLFLFLSDPLNIEKVYPKQLKAKVRKQDARYSVEIYLLGQFFNFDLIIKETRKYELIIDELRGPLFKKWINVHRIVEKGKELLMIDEIEFETKLGFIGDFFARKVIERIINYRNQSLLKIFGKESNPIFINPLQIDLVKGTSLLAFLTIFALVILILLPLNAIIDLILGLISWVLLWYSAHDLFHLIFGNILGIRFSYWYVGFWYCI
jgi:ligand-binding SRPBCC domain-containing protein